MGPGGKMGWHKFLIYFALFASAVLNLISGIATMNGNQYGEYAQEVYELMPALKTPDMVYGIVLIAIAALAIFTRFALAGFQRNGPKLVVALYGAVIIVSVIYNIWGASIVEAAASDLGISAGIDYANIGSSVAISAAMLAANASYYKKRESLFVN